MALVHHDGTGRERPNYRLARRAVGHLTNTIGYRILSGMTYQSVLESTPSSARSTERSSEPSSEQRSERLAAEASALAWLEQRLRFEAWLERVREHPGPQRGSGLAAAA